MPAAATSIAWLVFPTYPLAGPNSPFKTCSVTPGKVTGSHPMSDPGAKRTLAVALLARRTAALEVTEFVVEGRGEGVGVGGGRGGCQGGHKCLGGLIKDADRSL